MAAGGGTFVTHNKILPGAYINFVSKARALSTLGARGIVALPWVQDWGKEDEIVTIEAEDFQKNALNIFGYSYSDKKLTCLREVFKGASTVKLYRLGGGEKAAGEIGNDSNKLNITALYGGSGGNRIRVHIEENLDGTFSVKTLIGEDLAEIDNQDISDLNQLKNNDFVSFNGSGTPTAGTITLTGGTDKTVSNDVYSKFLDKVEREEFTTLLYAGSDDVTKGLFESFTKRLRDDEGYKITCVLHNYNKADYEGIISVLNNVEPVDGVCSEAGIVYWAAGKNAGAQVNESLTNAVYDGELSVNTLYKKSELKESINNGHFILYGNRGEVRVLKDINTFRNFSAEKNSDFANNQVIRIIDAIANDTARIFEQYYLGKRQNNEIGRDIFKTELINYHNSLQSIQAIDNFSPDDITVTKGAEKGDVVVNEYIEPIAAMEKLYMTCIIE